MEQRDITLRHAIMTADSAYTIVTQEMYAHQRPLNQSVVQEYALAMRKTEFRPGTTISFCVYQGRRYLINGQHTLHALIRADVSLLLGIEEIQVESLEEIAAWYGKYDRLRLRTLQHIYEAYDVHQHLNLNKSQTVCLGACLPMLASGFSSVPAKQGSLRMYTANAELRMAFMHNWIDEANQFFGAIKGAPGTVGMNIRRGPVMAVALVTYRFTGTDADEFWHTVCQAEALSQSDPRMALHMFLRSTKAGEFGPHRYSRYIASAWNNAWHGKRSKNVNPQAEHLPISLEGTPHDGKDVWRYITPQGEVLQEPHRYDAELWQAGLFGEAAAD
jgi:hypothetical protein